MEHWMSRSRNGTVSFAFMVNNVRKLRRWPLEIWICDTLDDRLVESLLRSAMCSRDDTVHMQGCFLDILIQAVREFLRVINLMHMSLRIEKPETMTSILVGCELKCDAL